ncbi:PilW family protein [Vreelandella jeotgali]|uniref:PilW family protein n=1 Tax=Vreelandella jeotgali TaxID=553386 RepID=UPI0003480334|nr:type II secretion system protein [Halomonas jeotgali]
MTTTSRQTGFTLVELMVALLIGSIVVLGAGYLFFTTFQTFQKVDELSRKQEAVIFAAHTLSSSIRKGKEDYELKCKKLDDQCRCTLIDENNDGQPVVTFSRSFDEGSSKEDCQEIELIDDDNIISLPLEENGKDIMFKVTNRPRVLNEYLSDEDD